MTQVYDVFTRVSRFYADRQSSGLFAEGVASGIGQWTLVYSRSGSRMNYTAFLRFLRQFVAPVIQHVAPTFDKGLRRIYGFPQTPFSCAVA